MKRTIDEQTLTSVLQHCRPAVRAALAEYVQRMITEHAEEVVSIMLYGSQARGEADDESDIDVFVIVRHNTPELYQALGQLAWEVQYKHGVVISDMIRDLDQFKLMQANRFPYYQSIEREGVVLWMSTSELTPSSA